MKKKLTAIINEALTGKATTHSYTIEEVNWICDQVQPLLLQDPCLIEIPAPVCICGDIHGQMTDLIRTMKIGGTPPDHCWLFLGDYVDRGLYSLEVLCFLFALKIKYPSKIYLLRGNHENKELNQVFGFYAECQSKVDLDTFNHITNVFEYLPFAAIVENSYLCIHGGLSPDFHSIQQIRMIDRPIATPSFGLLADLLWSDPDPNITDFAESPRGNTVIWGTEAVDRFLSSNDLLGIIRAHQMVPSGYDYPFGRDRQIFTIFSAPNYNQDVHNKGAFLIVEGPNQVSVKIINPVTSSSYTPVQGLTLLSKPPPKNPIKNHKPESDFSLPKAKSLKSPSKLTATPYGYYKKTRTVSSEGSSLKKHV